MISVRHRRWAWPLLALLAGAVHASSFAPFNQPWLQVSALAALFALAAGAASVRAAALLGFAFGLGWFGVGISWVYVSMHVYGAMPALLAAAATAAFCAYLAIYPALALGSAHRLFPNAWVRVALGMPALWAIAEWLRGTVFTGFPWLASGYAHSDGPLAGWAPVLGVYGVTLMAALLAGALAMLALPRPAGPPERASIGWLFAVLVLIVGCGWLGRSVEWTQPVGAPISVRLVQGNVPQDRKFEPDGTARAFNTHWGLMQGPRVDLVALPESVFPVPMQRVLPAYLDALQDFARTHRTALVYGVFLEEPRGHYFNSAVAYVPGAPQALLSGPLRYSKRHLVPFGEFIPPGFRWFVDMMQMPIGDQQRGASVEPLPLAGEQVAVNICYEDLFGAEIIDAWHGAGPPPTLMLNISNLAWFNDSLALPQHLQISRMRVLETQHPMLRATNTGATAIIDARGSVVARLPFMTAAALNGQVQGHTGTTPFIRFGNLPALALAALLLLAGVALSRRKDRHPYNSVQ